MKKQVLLILLFSLALSARGQIAVESFRMLENDLTAITNGTMETDQNGEVAALIKVVTTHRDFTFDGGMLGIVRVVVKPGEYWVYVPRKLMKISIAHPYLGLLRDYYFPMPIDGARTYELVLRIGQPATVLTTSAKKQEITLRVSPPNATLFIDSEEKELNEKGEFTASFPVGNHTYYAESDDYKSESGVFEVKDETNEPFTINLKSLFANLALTCPDGEATILVNGEEKGKGSWTGAVRAGQYAIEVSRENHESTYAKVELAEEEERTLMLTAPKPIYGFLHVESEPEGVSVLVDGKVVGVTPCDIDSTNQILIGEHRVSLSKEGYDPYSTTVTFRQEPGAVLSGIKLTQAFDGIISSVPGARLTLDGKTVGRTPYQGHFVVGNHHLRMEAKGYDVFEDTVRLSPDDPNPTFRLLRKPIAQTMFYVGAGAHVIGVLAADAVAGFYLGGFHGEFCFRYPFKASATAYYNLRSADGSASQSHTLQLSPGYGLQGLLGYGIRVGRQLRLTPAAGVRSTTLTGVTTDGSARDQRTYVLSGVGTVKVEYAPSPSLSLVAAPEYAVPVGKNDFVRAVENVCPSVSGWYGGLGLNVGIHINF